MKKRALNSLLIRAQRTHVRRAYARKTRRFQRENPALKSQLSADDRDAARRYWSRFGFTIDPEWHGIYAAVAGRFDPRYVPEDIYYALLEPALNALEHAPAYSDKNAHETVFPGVQVPPVLLRRVAGQFYSQDGEWLPEHDAVSRLGAAAAHDFVVKPSVCSGGGLHLALYSRAAAAAPGLSVDAVVSGMLAKIPGDLIAQACVRQHETLASLHPESLNTLKVLSIRKEGELPRTSCLLRVGAHGGFTDNGAHGGLCCAVDADGRLRGPWLDTFLRTFDTHPTTGAGFDAVLPGIEAARELVRSMHERLPYFGIANFDIAIGPDAEPVFVEVNLEGQDIQWQQWHNGPLFGDLTDWALARAAERQSQVSTKAARFIFRLSH